MSQESWRWYGLPGHFILARDCLFHLCTQVGSYLIFTVGCLKRQGDDHFSEIGYGRLYETMVFALEDSEDPEDSQFRRPISEVSNYIPRVKSWSELNMRAANSAQEATENHLELCHLYDGMPPHVFFEDENGNGTKSWWQRKG